MRQTPNKLTANFAAEAHGRSLVWEDALGALFSCLEDDGDAESDAIHVRRGGSPPRSHAGRVPRHGAQSPLGAGCHGIRSPSLSSLQYAVSALEETLAAERTQAESGAIAEMVGAEMELSKRRESLRQRLVVKRPSVPSAKAAEQPAAPSPTRRTEEFFASPSSPVSTPRDKERSTDSGSRPRAYARPKASPKSGDARPARRVLQLKDLTQVGRLSTATSVWRWS